MNRNEEIAFIGDVHGNSLGLENLLHLIPPNALCVFLGDLINRGPDSRGVLDTVSQLLQVDRAKVIRGNHETYFEEYLNGGSFLEFALRGGVPTILSYLSAVTGDVRSALNRAIPISHRQILRDSIDEFRADGITAKHWDSHADLILRGESFTSGDNWLIVGHRSHRGVLIQGDTIFLDTNSGAEGGRLSAFLWPSRTVLSV